MGLIRIKLRIFQGFQYEIKIRWWGKGRGEGGDRG